MSLKDAFDDAWRASPLSAASHDGVVVALLATADWAPFFAQTHVLLDAAEAARVQRKRRDDDRNTTALAYACHRLLLAQRLGCAPAAVPLIRDSQGCPRLPGTTLHTSLSHASGWVAIAVSGHGPVGVDIEPSWRTREMDEIAACVCHPRELARMAALPMAGRDHELLALWVRKEALLKAAGIGLAEEMSSFQAPSGQALELPGGTRSSARVEMLDGGPECMAALAGPPTRPVVVVRLQPIG